MGLPSEPRYPPIAGYGFLGDSMGAALVSRTGSIDWACLRRIDSGTVFGRLLDWDKGGFCRIAPTAPAEVSRRYVEHSLVVETTFTTGTGSIRLLDGLAMDDDGRPERHILRIVEGVEGEVEVGVELCVRFDYGALRPWVRPLGKGRYTIIGGDDGLRVWCDVDLEDAGQDDLCGTAVVRAGERRHLSLLAKPPHLLDPPPDEWPTPRTLKRTMTSTLKAWGGRATELDEPVAMLRRSALVLRALSNTDTGAIAAAATTSLPEIVGGESNWDYRYTWIRDSWMTVRALTELGDTECADAFRRFVERSAAGHVDELQIAFGVGGEHSLHERTLDHLEGWRGSRPVRIGNAAAAQSQHDAFGDLLELAWLWHDRGHGPDEPWWTFLRGVVAKAAEIWREPDHGMWEVRGERHHYVHSKIFCWVALDRGCKLGADLDHDPDELARWRAAADECRAAVLEHGVDARTGGFTAAFDDPLRDASVLLAPAAGFVDWRDPVMLATVDDTIERLVVDGFVRRREDWEHEGAFLACTFWLAECLAHQRRLDEARAYFERASTTANDLGLFTEEIDTATGETLGNVPQALTHLSHITAGLALRDERERQQSGNR